MSADILFSTAAFLQFLGFDERVAYWVTAAVAIAVVVALVTAAAIGRFSQPSDDREVPRAADDCFFDAEGRN
jgi:hypothetical protein